LPESSDPGRGLVSTLAQITENTTAILEPSSRIIDFVGLDTSRDRNRPPREPPRAQVWDDVAAAPS
jgi:hypothetical protein